MKKFIALLMLVVVGLTSYGQNDVMTQYANTITEEDLTDLLTILASDAMEGRETGERGQKMAAAFIADHFQRLGLQPVVPTKDGKSYFQKFNLESRKPGKTYIALNGEKLKNGDGTLYYGSNNSGQEVSLTAVYVGDGSESAFNGKDVSGHAVIIDNTSGGAQTREVRDRAYEKGAKMVFIVNAKNDTDWKSWITRYGKYYMGGSLGLPSSGNSSNGVFYIPPSTAAALLNIDVDNFTDISDRVANGDYRGISRVKKGSVTYFTETKIKLVETENVLGFLEGSDKKDEYVVLTAHYDHIGRNGDKINNGADDDGSGTSAVMEIAQAFVEAKKAGNGPRRSILFMCVTGEEKGLLGSEYYTDNPILPLENTVANLNIDMIGRTDKKHNDNREFVYLVGSDRLSSELHELSEKANETFTNLSLDYTYNDEDHPDRIYYRSDHWNFARKNIPIIFYFNGTHDDYHRPSDTVDKIEFDLLQKRAQLVFYTAWIVSNRDKRLVVDKLEGEKIKNAK